MSWQDLTIGVLVGGIIGFLIRYFLASYLTEKGKNQATKEDVEEITRKIELIRTAHAFLVEELKGKHQLRIAAIDERLAVQQMAFTLWKELFNSVHSPRVHEVVGRAQEFWNTKCLYLTPEARQAFYEAYHAAAMHSDLVDANRGRGKQAAEDVKANFDVIRRAGAAIVESINLPPIKGEETNVKERTGAA